MNGARQERCPKPRVRMQRRLRVGRRERIAWEHERSLAARADKRAVVPVERNGQRQSIYGVDVGVVVS